MLTVLRSVLETIIRDETEVYGHVAQLEMFRRIDRSYRRVFALEVQAFGQSYWRAESPTPIGVVAGTSVYDLAADFFQLITAAALVDGRHVEMKPLDPR